LYNPKAFQVEDLQIAINFMRTYNFATIVTQGPDGLDVSHVPVIVREGAQGLPVLHAHLARANSQWQHFDGLREALIVFQGPHGYVSPSLYEVHPSVPTWNYQVVHAHGVPVVIEDPNEVRRHVLELVEQHESGRPNRWVPDLPEDVLQSLHRQIVAIRIDLQRVEVKFKLGQNRGKADRESMARAFESSSETSLQELGHSIRSTLA